MKKVILAVMLLTAVFLITPKASYAVLVDPMISGLTEYVGSTGWTADVYWAVWAPDTESLLGTLEEYSYYYMVVNTSGAEGASLKIFSVGNPWDVLITSAGYIDLDTYPTDIEDIIWSSGIAPAFIDPAGDSVVYTFGTFEVGDLILGEGYIDSGENTDVLYFTSPWSPGWVNGGLLDGGITDYELVPGPVIPEPATMSLLGMGVLGLFGFRKKKS
ncbi:MAG: PEP-CTERM sorting domain-containing protein [bacterium]